MLLLELLYFFSSSLREFSVNLRRIRKRDDLDDPFVPNKPLIVPVKTWGKWQRDRFEFRYREKEMLRFAPTAFLSRRTRSLTFAINYLSLYISHRY